MVRTTVLAFLMLFAQTSLPADGPIDEIPPPPAGQTRILVPVLAHFMPGANGSEWDTEVWVTNTTDAPVLPNFQPCVIACCCDEIGLIGPQETQPMFFNQPKGQWIQLPDDSSLQVQARIRDRSRIALSAGVELPIVRDEDFCTDELNLIAIPTDPNFRVTLRLFAFEEGVRLRVEQIDTWGIVTGSDDVSLGAPARVYNGHVPAWAMRSLPPAPAPGLATRIRVRSLTEGARFWAFASVTNDETSEVTIIRPW